MLDGIKYETKLYFDQEDTVGGYSSLYCKKAWDEKRLTCDADLALFELLFQIDVENGAETTRILDNLCLLGAFAAVEVRITIEMHLTYII